MSEALARLAGAAGIEHGYWDALGTWRGLDDDTAAALLRALGLDPEGDIDAQARALERQGAADGAILPPVLIVRAASGSPSSCVLQIALPQRLCAGALRWELLLESGARIGGVFTPMPAGQAEARRPLEFRIGSPGAAPGTPRRSQRRCGECAAADRTEQLSN